MYTTAGRAHRPVGGRAYRPSGVPFRTDTEKKLPLSDPDNKEFLTGYGNIGDRGVVIPPMLILIFAFILEK